MQEVITYTTFHRDNYVVSTCGGVEFRVSALIHVVILTTPALRRDGVITTTVSKHIVSHKFDTVTKSGTVIVQWLYDMIYNSMY